MGYCRFLFVNSILSRVVEILIIIYLSFRGIWLIRDLYEKIGTMRKDNWKKNEIFELVLIFIWKFGYSRIIGTLIIINRGFSYFIYSFDGGMTIFGNT